MWKFSPSIFVLLVSASCQSFLNAATCEEIETSLVKLELAKQSIRNAKSLYPECRDERDNSNCTSKDRSLAHLNAALDLISEIKTMCRSCPEIEKPEPEDKPLAYPRDCSEVQSLGFNKSGVYQVWPREEGLTPNKSLDVYCDMKTVGGGWTVIQRRGNFTNRTDFYRDWNTYGVGFGNLREEFWLGNEKIHTLTKQGNYSVRFDLVTVSRLYRYATYKKFCVEDEESGYVLHISDYSGNASDYMNRVNGKKFSTWDRQNDGRGATDGCAKLYTAAFWYSKGCGLISLNGVYQDGAYDGKGIWWYTDGTQEFMSSVEIKIRRAVA